MDQFTSYERVGYFSRIGQAIRGILIGGFLFLASFALLFWNEGRAVHRAKALAEGAASVITVDSKMISPANEGKLVHFTGDAVGEKLTDDLFGLSREGVRLRRVVEMYQYKEEKKTESKKDAVGGGDTKKTTYSYPLVWSEKLIDSDKFEGGGRNDPKYTNPGAFPVEPKTISANNVMVGAFKLTDGLTGQMSMKQPVPVESTAGLDNLPDNRKESAVVREGIVYLPGRPSGKVDPSSPHLGDARVKFELIPNGPVTVVAQQAGQTLSPYKARTGELLILHDGTETAAVAFQKEQDKNTVLTWVLRVVGFLAMWIGLGLILAPFKVMADLIGIVGDIVGMGIALASGFISLALSLTTVAIAWIFYRPLLGIGLLALAGVVTFLLMRMKGKRRMAGPPAMARV